MGELDPRIAAGGGAEAALIAYSVVFVFNVAWMVYVRSLT